VREGSEDKREIWIFEHRYVLKKVREYVKTFVTKLGGTALPKTAYIRRRSRCVFWKTPNY
jgi:hypothetical protein